jgi:hypothetical protein
MASPGSLLRPACERRESPVKIGAALMLSLRAKNKIALRSNRAEIVLRNLRRRGSLKDGIGVQGLGRFGGQGGAIVIDPRTYIVANDR